MAGEPDTSQAERVLALEAELAAMTDELLGRYEEITLLYDVSLAVGSLFDVAAIAATGLEKALHAVGASRGALVALAGPDDEQLTVAAARGFEKLVGSTVPRGRGISGYVAASGRQLLLHEGEPGPPEAKLGDPPLEAVLSVPLVLSDGSSGKGATVGALTLVGKPSGERFSAGDAKLVTAIASQLAIAIHNVRLIDSLREAERVRQEIETAAEIQRTLLPAGPPEVAGVELAGRCLPAARVGGDYYDLLLDEAGRLYLVIADVAGHSIGSALMMAMARTILRREIAAGKSPARVLAAANDSLFGDLVNSGLFITMFCVRYDPEGRLLTFANAGHNLPLLRRAGGALEELGGDGAAIGILPGGAFEERSLELEQGDLLLMYTDGVVEALGPGGEPFGDWRLQALVAEAGETPPGELADRILAAVRRHTAEAPAQDDITMVGLRA